MTTDAIRACRRTLERGSRSFALASRLLPPGARDEAAVVYAWCRRADDAVDLATGGGAAGALARLRGELEAVYAGGGAGDLTLDAFADVVRRRAIPRSYPEELLEGMAMDVCGARYDSVDDLLVYGFRVAGTVGLMMCHVMGIRDDRALEHAAHLGIAMQLTNICRDVAEDWDRGRLYVPDAILRDAGAAGLAEALGGPLPADARAPMARAVADLLARADAYYASGDRGLQALPRRCAVAVRAARLVYAEIGVRLRDRGCDALAGRVVVPGPRKLALAARSVGAALAPTVRPARAPRTPRSEIRCSDVVVMGGGESWDESCVQRS